MSGGLTLAEGTQLSAALLARVTAACGVRALVIKGPSLEAHGLRTGHVSADLDLLFADRDDVETIVDALSRYGWRLRGTTFGADRMTTHSLTLLHDYWPNDLDLHWEFPGIARSAFDVLWERRQPLALAGSTCWMPDRLSSIVLWALHSLRGNPEEGRHDLEWRRLVDDVLPALDPAERSRLADRAVELGAGPALAGAEGFDALLAGRSIAEPDPAWLRKVAQAHEVTPWYQVLRETPLRQRPKVLWNAVWPSAHDLRLLDENLVDTPAGRIASRLRRVQKVLRRALTR